MRAIRGFTLIEMVVVMIIMGLVSTGAAMFLRAGFAGYFSAVQSTTLSTQANLAMARISKELQQADAFSVINTTGVTFSTTGGATISYNWSSPNLTRTGATTPQALSNAVTAFSLSYYQSNFSMTDEVSAVRAITISMTLNNGSETLSLINTVFLNNIS